MFGQKCNGLNKAPNPNEARNQLKTLVAPIVNPPAHNKSIKGGNYSKQAPGRCSNTVNLNNRTSLIVQEFLDLDPLPIAQNHIFPAQKESTEGDVSFGDPSKFALSLGKSILPFSPSKGHLEVLVECLDADKGQFDDEEGLPFGHEPSIARAESEIEGGRVY